MKIPNLKLLVLLLLINTHFAKAQNHYSLSGTIKGINKGTVYLSHTVKEVEVLDSAKIVNGNFSFTGTTPEVLMYSLKVKGNPQQKNFLLENSRIEISAHKDSLSMAKVTGSKENDIYFGFYKGPWLAISAQAGKIYRKLDSASQNGKITLTPEQRKPFDNEFKILDSLNQKEIRKYITANQNSIAAAAIIKDRFIDYPNFKVADELYKLLSTEAQQSFYGRTIRARVDLNNMTSPGKLAPDFIMNDVDGRAVKLSDLRGNYVLVDFWASWCGPCRRENPNVVAAYKKYHQKGFEILGVSLDNKREPWLKAIRDDGLNWKHVSDLKGWANSAAVAYGVSSVPASFLLDKEGRVVAKDLRGEILDKKLEEIFKN